MRIIEGDETIELGSTGVTPTVIVKVVNPAMWTRILISYDLGCQLVQCFLELRQINNPAIVSEAYMEGEFEVSDLKSLLNVSTLKMTGCKLTSKCPSSSGWIIGRPSRDLRTLSMESFLATLH